MRISISCVVLGQDNVRKLFLIILDLVLFIKRDHAFQFQAMRCLKLADLDLHLGKDLVFESVVDLVLENHNVLKEVFHNDHYVFCVFLG